MFTAVNTPAPFSIRYPRGNGVMADWRRDLQMIEIGKGRMLRDGNELAVLSIGHMGNLAEAAVDKLEKEGRKVGLYDMRFVKPLDEEMLHAIFSKYTKIITIEDGCVQGGFGSAVLEFMADHGYSAQVKRLGIPDRLVEHGTQQELWAECAYDEQAIYETAVQMLGVAVEVE
jgi:1-deoxy-D-xylulose-5-phosphate synthase